MEGKNHGFETKRTRLFEPENIKKSDRENFKEKEDLKNIGQYMNDFDFDSKKENKKKNTKKNFCENS